MKRRKLAPAVLVAVLVVAALAAASVSAATSAQKSVKTSGKGSTLGLHTNKNPNSSTKGQNLPAKFVAAAQFKPTVGTPPKFIHSPTPSNAKSILAHDQRIPGKLAKNGGKAPNTGAAPGAPFIPHAHSLPIVSKKYVAQAPGLNAYNQDFAGGYTDTPPDQGLGEGNGYVFEAVNNVFQISDTNFGHMTNAEPMEQFWGPAILATGYCDVSDPKVHYDQVTRKWYVTEVAYGLNCGQPGSAVFIAVSTTSDPLSIYNIYVLDTSFDGTTCGADGCLADQPLLGMNRNALIISTNSYDIDTCEFGLGPCAFNGTQLYVLDSTALAAGFVFPNLAYEDVGQNYETPEGYDDCGGGVLPDASPYPFNPFCWYSLQPATTPNGAQFSTDRGGTEFLTSALDWFGSVDNRVAVWALTNTSAISSFSQSCFFPSGSCAIFLDWAIASTESYGFPFTDTPGFTPYAEQPSSGNTPLCDTFVGPFCEPGPIANNDDRMNELEAVKPANGAAHLWSGLNSDGLVPDPLGHLHRRSIIAYFDTMPTAWCGPFICGAGVHSQGYVANWNNDVIFPAIGIPSDTNGTSGAMVFTLTGNTNFPSVAVTKVGDSAAPSSIPVVLAGQDVLDDFGWYFFGDPRWGDYSAAVGDGHSVFLGTEYIQHQSCSDADFVADPTCGGTRSEYSNWGTGLVKVNV